MKHYPVVEIHRESMNMQIDVEIFLRVFGRLPTGKNDVVDAGVAKKYLQMWLAKRLDKYEDGVRRRAILLALKETQ